MMHCNGTTECSPECRYVRLAERSPRHKTTLRTLATRAVAFGVNAMRHIYSGGHASKDEQQRRLSICEGCELFTDGKCSACGCGMTDKVIWLELDCPHPKGSRWKQ
jgi:hypothetical protein